MRCEIKEISSMNEASPITVKVAETEDELRAAYRLRYQVFTEELGDDRYADDELKEFKDFDDVEGSILFVAVEAEEVIGSVRLKPLRNRDFIALDAYGLPRLAEEVSQDLETLKEIIGCLDRGVVHPDFRGKKIISTLMKAGEKKAVELGLTYLLGATDIDNIAAKMACSKLDYVEYHVGTYNGTTCQCIYKVLKKDGLR